MKMNEKKTEELMTSLSPRFIREFADPAVIERKSHPEWAIILFLVLSLSVIGVVVGGSKANAGNTIPTEKVVIPKGTTPLEIKDYTILPGYEITRLYVMGVKTDHPEYQKACQAIRDAADFKDQEIAHEKANRQPDLPEEMYQALINQPNYYREVDLDLGVPLFFYAAVRATASEDALFNLHFVFPVIRDGRLVTTVTADRFLDNDGNSYYVLAGRPVNRYVVPAEGKYLVGNSPLSEDEKELIYQLNTFDVYAYEAASKLTSAENPLYVTGMGRVDSVVVKDTLYKLGGSYTEVDNWPASWEEKLAAGLDKAFLSDMGFELELKVWPLGK